MIKTTLLAATAFLAASGASATVTSSFTPGGMGLHAGDVLIDNFETTPDTHFTSTGPVGIYQGTTPGVAAAPAGDTSHYLAVLGGGSATFDFGQAYKSISFDIGSVDSYNSLMVTLFGSGKSVTLTGEQLNGTYTADGNQTSPMQNGRLRIFGNAGEAFTGLTLKSSSNSFEIDNLAVNGAVPEPASWAMMVVGFGALGSMLRRRQTVDLGLISAA